jgi:hypothetical protein
MVTRGRDFRTERGRLLWPAEPPDQAGPMRSATARAMTRSSRASIRSTTRAGTTLEGETRGCPPMAKETRLDMVLRAELIAAAEWRGGTRRPADNDPR